MKTKLAMCCCLYLIMASKIFAASSDDGADQRWALSGGSINIMLDSQSMKEFGVTLIDDGHSARLMQVVAESSTFQLSRSNDHNDALFGTLITEGGMNWETRTNTGAERFQIGDLHIGFGGRYATVSDGRDLHLEILEFVPETMEVQFDSKTSMLSVSGEIRFAEQFLQHVLDSKRDSKVVGRMTIEGPARLATSKAPQGLSGERLLHGCDVTTGELRGDVDNPTSQPKSWGIAGAYAGYSFGTTSCNIGILPMSWYSTGSATPSEHPVIAQTLLRYNVVNGASRIEMLGQAWLKHGFCALQGSVCLSCTPYCGGCCDHLGVGCSDPYNASRNGGRTGMGPKSQLNAATGQILVWPYPTAPQDDATTGRVRVLTSEVDPAQNSGAKYFAEGQYLSSDEVNNLNNCSYRRVVFGGGPSFTMSWFSTAPGQTVRQTQGIKAWGIEDPAVAFVDIDVPSDGRFTLGYRVTDLSGIGNGPWHYEYALHNMTSDRSGSSFSVPLPAGVVTSNPGFRDVEYYKDGATLGTSYDGTDWPVTSSPGTSIAWNMVPASPLDNSNALRWGTMYNFRFDATTPPVAGQITLGLFKPGSPTSMSIAALVPAATPCSCPGDLNASNTVDGDDIAPFSSMYLAQSPVSNCADVAAPNGGSLDTADVNAFVDLLVNGTNTCK